ncbi:unnamed protein product [Acanthoscelides obtectus]|uniref:Uncharacterized protein n=1 Tax=Acanthoscelides obtectus TaxID=200917 RepID=A0A9P0M144_ACAOB|nr:unnamed protein product [Acanthoscelides obtectus]CAK1670759.1 hypothetical protein AOBTE_LOCUS27810 [Acanthoscelides obtectus]
MDWVKEFQSGTVQISHPVTYRNEVETPGSRCPTSGEVGLILPLPVQEASRNHSTDSEVRATTLEYDFEERAVVHSTKIKK